MLDSPLKLYHAVAAGQLSPVNVIARVQGGAPATFGRALMEIAASVDPDLQMRNIISLDQALRREHWIRRLEAAVLAAITVTVVMLSAAGIYAMMSFTVSQRQKEIGIRMALGANRARIVASIFSRAFGQLAVGAVLGVAAAVILETASGDSLMRGNAWLVVPIVALFMMAAGLLATLVPSRKCLSIEAADALRDG